MDEAGGRRTGRWVALAVVLGVVAVAAFVAFRDHWPRSEGLVQALAVEAQAKNPDRATVAVILHAAFSETRANASRWSGIFWGFSFAAVALSAVAGLILKLEAIPWSDTARKDAAATLSVLSALIVTISTNGDFHRKWQANRLAAAQIEDLSYRFLRDPATDPRRHLTELGRIQLQRQMEIVGGQGATLPGAADAREAKAE